MKLVEQIDHAPNHFVVPEVGGYSYVSPPVADVLFPIGPSQIGQSDYVVIETGRDVFDRYGIRPRSNGHALVVPGKDVAGAFVVLHTVVGSKPFLLVQREKETKPWNGKMIGDYSVPAETLNGKDRSLVRTAVRGVAEETALREQDIQLSPVPIGYFRIRGEGSYSDDFVWVQAFSAYVNFQILQERRVHPEDGQTDSLHLAPPLVFLGGYPARAAAQGIVACWLHGMSGIVAEASPSARQTGVLYRYYNDRVSNESIR